MFTFSEDRVSATPCRNFLGPDGYQSYLDAFFDRSDRCMYTPHLRARRAESNRIKLTQSPRYGWHNDQGRRHGQINPRRGLSSVRALCCLPSRASTALWNESESTRLRFFKLYAGNLGCKMQCNTSANKRDVNMPNLGDQTFFPLSFSMFIWNKGTALPFWALISATITVRHQ